NTALIGHANFAGPCGVLSSLSAAEAAIFKPNGAGGNVFVTRVTADEWNALLPSGPSALSANLDQTHVRLTWANGPAYPRVRLLRGGRDADDHRPRHRRRAAGRRLRHLLAPRLVVHLPGPHRARDGGDHQRSRLVEELRRDLHPRQRHRHRASALRYRPQRGE